MHEPFAEAWRRWRLEVESRIIVSVDTTKQRLAVTMGDINGVGPEILAKASARLAADGRCVCIVLGSARAYESARAMVPGAVHACAIESLNEVDDSDEKLFLWQGRDSVPERRAGILDGDAGRSAMGWLETAVGWALEGGVDAIVTCPINKAGIRAGGFDVMGHTDYIARLTSTEEYRMSLFSESMRIVHVTGHVSLKQAIESLKKKNIAQTIRIGHEALGRIGLERRAIAVAGLNPHAGEGGMLGEEETTEILPAILGCQAEGIACSGPYPPDTIFRRMCDGEFDMVIAMYHDQGHIPLKLLAMNEAVNVTLGIPIVRTSVAHGTAYDIAGTGTACEDSLLAAVRLAVTLAQSRERARR